MKRNKIAKNIFYNSTQNRLKAGWRILIYFLGFFTAIALMNLIIQNLISIRIIRSLVSLIITSITALVTLWLAGRYLDHRRFKDYGFILTNRWWLDFIFGFILSALLFCIVFLFEKAMGWIDIVGYFQNQREGYIGQPFIIPLIIGFIAYFSVGLYEEILFRAYQIKNLSEGFNRKNSEAKKALIGAYIVSSIIFSIFHSGNPNITFIGLINLMFLGLFLGLPYILSGQLGMSIALHISWNFFQGLVFGFPVSGVFNNITIIAIEQGGSTIWTGGAFGPEGGLIGTFTLIVGCSFILLWFKILGRTKFLFKGIAEYNS